MFTTSLDITFSFFCRSSHKYSNGENPIVFRIVYRGERRDIFTGLTCPTEYWSAEFGMVVPKHKAAVTINKNLKAIEAKAQQKFDLLLLKNEEFSIDELVEAIKGKTPPPQNILDYIELKEQEIKDSVGARIATTTWYKYQRTIRYFKDFLHEKKGIKNIPVSKVDDQFVEQFFNYLKKEKKNSHNSATALMGCMSSILMPAVKNKVIKFNPFMGLKLSRKPVIRDFLEMEEIEKLEKLDNLSEAQRLKRDIFLLAVFTGLAYGDIKKLCKDNIKKDNDGTYYIQHSRKKTGIMSTIPLLPPAIRILQYYSPTEDFRDFQWRIPSNQKVNSGLKEIGELAGISKKLFVHLGRHTFATTVTMSNNVSMESVSKMLGHSTLKHTQIYAKIVATKVKSEMNQLRSVFQ
ncbi:MAG: site-specific integrase [Bacteroidota bacterium]|nr:site-specific integrase [Bacteroidota bacterium]